MGQQLVWPHHNVFDTRRLGPFQEVIFCRYVLNLMKLRVLEGCVGTRLNKSRLSEVRLLKTRARKNAPLKTRAFKKRTFFCPMKGVVRITPF